MDQEQNQAGEKPNKVESNPWEPSYWGMKTEKPPESVTTGEAKSKVVKLFPWNPETWVKGNAPKTPQKPLESNKTKKEYQPLYPTEKSMVPSLKASDSGVGMTDEVIKSLERDNGQMTPTQRKEFKDLVKRIKNA